MNFPVAESLQSLETAPKDIRNAMALKLVRDFIHNNKGKGLKALRPIVEALCLHARKRYKAPLHVVPPRHIFANPSVLDGPALQALSVLQDRVLPALEADLAKLPPRPAIPMGTRPWHTLKDTDRAELGRLLMLGIWRLGLQRWSAVSSWLTALLGKEGEPEVILAQGDNRYMVLSVACDGSRPSMRRTVFLDDFTAAYLALELPTLRPLLQSLLTPDDGETAEDLPAQEEDLGAEENLDDLDEDQLSEDDPETEDAPATKDDSSIKVQGALPADTTDQQRKKKAGANRYSRAQTCLNAYLRQIDVDLKNLSLSTLFAAAGQHLMMTTAPIISAYAMGKIETEDLGDRDIRRLGGLTPSRGNGREDDNRRPNTSVWNVQTPPIPKDVLAHEKIWSVIGPHQGLRKQKWLRQIKSHAPQTPIEALLQQFAIWQIEQLDNKPPKDQAPLPPSQNMSRHEVRVILRNSRIIASLFLGFSSTQGTTTRLDRDALQRLHDFGSEHFTEREMQQVWRRFHTFLEKNKNKIKGFEVSEIGNASDDNISAHLLSAEEIETIRALLLSPKSGIGNVDYRQIAQRHFDLMRNFGLRRAESAYLRGIDIQGNLGRVQPYGSHTLKTTNATRTLPLAFADQTTQSWMQKASEAKHKQLINIDAGGLVEPDNFFNALNTLIKKVSQEDNMGSHHVRHTLASRVLLTLLWEAAGLQRLTNDFPWLTGLRLHERQIGSLFGPEGDAGQGMRAISALVGHSHPTTTLRHYIHILCFALRGALDKTDTLSMRHSFIQRLGPRSTAFRTLANAGLLPPKGKGSPSRRELNRKIRLWVEQRTKNASLIVNETPLVRPQFNVQPPRSSPDKQVKIHFDDLERLDRVLRGEASEAQTHFNLPVIRRRMIAISQIPSGKRGTTDIPRHMMQEVGGCVVLPQRVAAGTATEAAEALCHWLEDLRSQKEEVFHWLLGKWLLDSERERGRMRLKTPQDEALFEELPQTQHVRMVKEAKVLSQRDKSGKTKSAAYMRLRYVNSEGKLSNRDLITVRWVMTFVAAVWGRKGSTIGMPRIISGQN